MRTEETVRAPEQRAKIKAVSLHQLTSSRDWYCSLSEKETEKETGVEEDKTEKNLNIINKTFHRHSFI